MEDYVDVDTYLADSDQWPDEIAATVGSTRWFPASSTERVSAIGLSDLGDEVST